MARSFESAQKLGVCTAYCDGGIQPSKTLAFYTPKESASLGRSPTLRRRLETVDIMLTCLRAGIDTLGEDIRALRAEPSFYPAFALRPAMISWASCSVFTLFGGMV